jgi:hypothetical protein
VQALGQRHDGTDHNDDLKANCREHPRQDFEPRVGDLRSEIGPDEGTLCFQIGPEPLRR